MADKITITSLYLSQQTPNGVRHVINYLNSKGEQKCRHVFENDPFFQTALTLNLANGQQWDMKQREEGKYWKIAEMAPPGTFVQPGQTWQSKPKAPYTSNSTTRSTAYTPNPDKDLSMELGGLMHDAVSLATKVSEVEAIVRELYLIKRRVSDDVKAGTIQKVTESVTKSAPASNVAPNQEEDDDNPFPY